MLPARRNVWFSRLFARYNERFLLRRHFHSYSMKGTPDPLFEGKPVLYLMNHSSWWDGLLAFHVLSAYAAGEHYMMMDEAQLKDFAFFRRLGAFSVNRYSPKDIARTLSYAQRLLRAGGRVWVFPQGEIQHAELRPLRFQRGVCHLLERLPDTVVIPVTAYYSNCLHQRADASIWFGEPVTVDWRKYGRDEAIAFLQAGLQSQLDRHRELAIAAPDGKLNGFVPVLRQGSSISEWYRSWKRRVTAWSRFSGS
ncbi:1-acyl-sn-glycerol-3-phosphate acyltransferase [Paenibacillus phyllosphaerae]|uniref:1-acyl-sn-glycerol-3-phosphate acyltransferase n=1 Tax=Paenibacillus phyllosphaerae TaxID=274593 RepID=A0A7W5B1U4_9BACL|nr:lysophospholipid acyltransferase family protein [Paenibacillus phyllosphaerae]MBB3112894.1 1-acyl-sn-glycerol-3-phosphate acyltransferase [Paenibacillus phyllosphaerae]